MRLNHTTVSNHILATLRTIVERFVERQLGVTPKSAALRDTEHGTFKNSSTSTRAAKSVTGVCTLCVRVPPPGQCTSSRQFPRQILTRHRTRELRDFSVPVTRCRNKSSLSLIKYQYLVKYRKSTSLTKSAALSYGERSSMEVASSCLFACWNTESRNASRTSSFSNNPCR